MNIRLGDNLITSFVTEHRRNPVLLYVKGMVAFISDKRRTAMTR